MAVQFSKRQIEILKASGKLLSGAGVSGLTIKNLAKEMEFSESAIYRHFPSKEAIIIALLNYLADTMDQNLSNTLSQVQGPIEKFEALFHEQLDFFQANPHFMVAVFSDGLMEESQSINYAISQIMGVKRMHLLPIVAEGQKRALFLDEITSEELVLIVMGSFRLQMYRWRVANFEYNIAKTGRKLIQSLLILIKKQS
jgi:AcrR family transcriptional regulator